MNNEQRQINTDYQSDDNITKSKSNPTVFPPQKVIKIYKNSFFKDLFIFILLFLLVGCLLAMSVAWFVYTYPQNDLSQKIKNNIPSISTISNVPVGQSSFSSSKSPVQFTQPTTTKSAVEVIEANLPSVVSINILSRVNQQATAGTGFVVTNDGLIITNKHVVSFACSFGAGNLQISALSSDQKVYELELLSIDPVDDIAILKIKNPPVSLSKIEFGDSSKLKLGEDVVAVGNALGTLQNTVTKGVISGLVRSFDTQDLKDECTNNEFRVDNLIQTDAAINKGNSGGPLFNSAGQMIGMNTLGTDAQSVGLAIPSSTIVTVLNGYLKNQAIIRPRLGVISQEINPIKKLKNPWIPVDYGEFVGSLDVNISQEKVVSAGSSADEAGIRYGDIILEINGEKLLSRKDNPSPLRRNILSKQAGDIIEITVLKSIANKESGTLSYEILPTKIKVKLKGINYNLTTNKTSLIG